MVRRILAITLFLGAFSSALPARANIALGVGVSGDFAVGDDAIMLPASWSVDGLLGYRIKLNALEITPELDLTYLKSARTPKSHELDWSFEAGGRVGLELGTLVPSAYLHFGLGTVELVSVDLLKHRKTGPYVEVGGALDFRPTESISLGVQVGYGAVSLSAIDSSLDKASVKWLRAGPRLTLHF